MRHPNQYSASLAFALLLLACQGGGANLPPRDTGLATDADDDFISDTHEEGFAEMDSDGDGTPDYLDDDTDGDSIPDVMEAGDRDLATPPRDADQDGTPDFRSPDSDGNGIPDAEELMVDTDGDGLPDFTDPDDDDDFAPDAAEIEAVAGLPEVDTDLDGIPNFKDPDSDDDNILDGDEPFTDTDGDGKQDWRDDDSDHDGLPDLAEAGDEDLYSRPIDSDDDGTPDFRDPDSDNDGISDRAENQRGTSELETDTDGDGVSDLIEIGAGTDALDPTDSPRIRGDFVFVVPYEQEPVPARDTLEFRTNIQFADVYFLIDTTGSMIEEISPMRSAVVSIIDNMLCEDFGQPCERDNECRADQVCGPGGTCIEDPTRSSCVASLWTGAGVYWGEDSSYRNLLSLQELPDETQSRIPMRADGGGGSESLFESVACVADPSVCRNAMCASNGIGCPGFREDAVKVLVTVTDEDNQCSIGCRVNTAMEAGARLRDTGISFVGVDADDEHMPRQDLESIALAAESLSGAGEPLVFDGNAAAAIDAVTTAINEIVDGVPLEVTIEATDEPDDSGDALQFIGGLEINTSGGLCSNVETADMDGDGAADSFPHVIPGTPVCWDVIAAANDSVAPTEEPQVFEAKLTVKGDGSPLDARTVFFLVPPHIGISLE